MSLASHSTAHRVIATKSHRKVGRGHLETSAIIVASAVINYISWKTYATNDGIAFVIFAANFAVLLRRGAVGIRMRA